MRQDIDGNIMNMIKASLLDCYTDFIAIANKDREIIYFNPAAYRMMGYESHEKPDIKRTEDLHTLEADEIARTQIQPSVFKNGFWRGISYIKHKDGSPITVEMTVFPIYSQGGEEYGTVAIMRDVDELSKLNEQLRKSSEIFQQVMDSARIGIVLINMETNTIEMANEFTNELMQFDNEMLVGKKCYDMLCHRSLDMCPHMNQKDKFLLSERFIERKDGTLIPIIKTGTRIKIGNVNYLVDTFVDISIQKELEKKLQEAKFAAETANRSKSEFLSRMSHEMRTPLNAIIGMAQISEKANDVDKLKNCIETIKLSSSHLLGLINDILDLSKIEEGKLELNIETFAIAEMIQKLNLLISPKAKEKNIRFIINLDPDIPQYLSGDSLRISQILLNFLSNAVKFTPDEGEIHLEIKCISTEQNTVTLHFAVRDSGIGITKEQLEKLFNPFTQADGSITRKYGGTGLGLVINKRLINLMNSDVAVTSEYGKGSVFAFDITLPVSANENHDIKNDADDFDSEHSSNIFAGKKLLVVDDVDINRIIIREFLSETGLEYDEAENGKIAVQKASQNLYDIILMDIQMPVMDGYEATQKIRSQISPYSDVPILAMSANVFKEDIKRSIDTGMNAHIGKPVDSDELLKIIHRMFKEKDSARTENIKKPAESVKFKENIKASDYDAGQFDFHRALADQNNELHKLEVKCHDFIQGTLYYAIIGAVSSGSYDKAIESLGRFIELSDILAMSAVTAFAKNVAECLKLRNYDYAEMYLNDLKQWYIKVCELIKSLCV